jgi:hypothetical protein
MPNAEEYSAHAENREFLTRILADAPHHITSSTPSSITSYALAAVSAMSAPAAQGSPSTPSTAWGHREDPTADGGCGAAYSSRGCPSGTPR